MLWRDKIFFNIFFREITINYFIYMFLFLCLFFLPTFHFFQVAVLSCRTNGLRVLSTRAPTPLFFGRRLAFGQKITYYRTHLGVEAAFCLENLDAIGNCVEVKNTPDAFCPINKPNYFSWYISKFYVNYYFFLIECL